MIPNSASVAHIGIFEMKAVNIEMTKNLNRHTTILSACFGRTKTRHATVYMLPDGPFLVGLISCQVCFVGHKYVPN